MPGRGSGNQSEVASHESRLVTRDCHSTSDSPQIDRVQRAVLQPLRVPSLVERVDQSTGARLHDIGRGAVAGQCQTVDLGLEKHLSYTVPPRSDRPQVQAQYLDCSPEDLAHRGKGCGDGSVASGSGRAFARPGAGQTNLRGCRHAATHHPQVRELKLLRRVVEALVDQGQQVLVQDLPLSFRQRNETLIDLRQLSFLELVAQLLVTALQRVPARVFPQDQSRPGNPHHLGADDLVGQTVLEHAVLVNSGLVSKGVAAHDCLVWRWKDSGEVGQQLAGAVDLSGIDPALELERRPSHPAGHDQLLQRRVTRSLADAVDGALHLPGARLNGRKTVRHSEPEIVVTVGTEHYPRGLRHLRLYEAEHRSVLPWRGVAHGVGQVDR